MVARQGWWALAAVLGIAFVVMVLGLLERTRDTVPIADTAVESERPLRQPVVEVGPMHRLPPSGREQARMEEEQALARARAQRGAWDAESIRREAARAEQAAAVIADDTPEVTP